MLRTGLLPHRCRTEVGVRLSQERSAAATVLTNTSDAGADQAAASRKLLMTRELGSVAVIGQLCLHHQLHLAAQKSLERTSGKRYWSGLAMICHLWRSAGMLHKVRQRFADLFGEAAAARCSSTAPPTPLRGRWGAVHASEAFLLRCEWQQLRAVSEAQTERPGIQDSVSGRTWAVRRGELLEDPAALCGSSLSMCSCRRPLSGWIYWGFLPYGQECAAAEYARSVGM